MPILRLSKLSFWGWKRKFRRWSWRAQARPLRLMAYSLLQTSKSSMDYSQVLCLLKQQKLEEEEHLIKYKSAILSFEEKSEFMLEYIKKNLWL